MTGNKTADLPEEGNQPADIAALKALINKGATVFPLAHAGETVFVKGESFPSPEGKEPKPHWPQGFKTPANVQEVDDNADRKWAIVPGSIGLCVADLDDLQVEDRFRAIASQHGVEWAWEPTYKPGRKHLVFKSPEGPISNAKWLGGEIRGTNGYVVMHTGASRWLTLYARFADVEPASGEFIPALKPQPVLAKPKPLAKQRVFSKDTPADLSRLLWAIGDCPYDDCFRAVSGFINSGGTAAEAREWVNGHAATNPDGTPRGRHRPGWVEAIEPNGTINAGTLVQLGRQYPSGKSAVQFIPTVYTEKSVEAKVEMEAALSEEEEREEDLRTAGEKRYDEEFDGWKQGEGALLVDSRKPSVHEGRLAAESMYKPDQTKKTGRYINSTQMGAAAMMSVYGADRSSTPYICVADNKAANTWYKKKSHDTGGVTWIECPQSEVEEWVGGFLRKNLGEWVTDKKTNQMYFNAWEEKAGGWYPPHVLRFLAGSAPFRHKATDFDLGQLTVGLPGGMLFEANKGGVRVGEDRAWCEGSYRKADPDDLVFRKTSVAPVQPTKEQWDASLFARFLNTFVPDPRERLYLQAYCGTMALGRPVARKVLWIHGESNAGKSLFASFVRWLLGRSDQGGYGATVSSDIFVSKKKGDGGSVHKRDAAIAQLVGVRGGVISEVGSGEYSVIDNEAFKSLMGGGDELVGRALGKDPISFASQLNLLVVSNFRPPAGSFDPAVFNRLVQITVHAAPWLDEELESKLRSKEESEWAMDWLLAGARLVADKGLPPETEAMRGEAKTTEEAADPVGKFIEELCVKQPDARVPLKEFWAAYQSWDDGEEENSGSDSRWLAAKLRDKGYTIKKTKVGGSSPRCVHGLAFS